MASILMLPDIHIIPPGSWQQCSQFVYRLLTYIDFRDRVYGPHNYASPVPRGPSGWIHEIRGAWKGNEKELRLLSYMEATVRRILTCVVTRGEHIMPYLTSLNVTVTFSLRR